MSERIDSACWPPATDLQALQRRAELYRHIRDFFATRQVLEVSTPQLAHFAVTEPNIDCIAVPGYGYLQSSPEYHMKRLLAAGSGAIYQIAHAFRHGEMGQRHNPEFHMLEWYRPGFTLTELVDECCELLAPVLATTQVIQLTFRQAFAQATGLDPITATLDALQQAVPHDQQLPALERPALVDWLMACVVEPSFPAQALTVVTNFPGWAAALARTREDDDGELVAQRFEMYSHGLELANGYLELTEADEQRRRFLHDQQVRHQHGKVEMASDPWLLAALASGLPDCAGVAVGIERVLMAARASDRISTVLEFPFDRA